MRLPKFLYNFVDMKPVGVYNRNFHRRQKSWELENFDTNCTRENRRYEYKKNNYDLLETVQNQSNNEARTKYV